MASRTMTGVVSDYSRLRTVPAMLSIVFALASLYQFGGISQVNLTWLDYTLSAQHAMLVSLGTLVVAFASSETKQFDSYEDWEMAVIAAGPLLIVTYQYIPEITDLVNGSDITQAVAFMVSIAAWGVAVR